MCVCVYVCQCEQFSHVLPGGCDSQELCAAAVGSLVILGRAKTALSLAPFCLIGTRRRKKVHALIFSLKLAFLSYTVQNVGSNLQLSGGCTRVISISVF